MPSPFAATTSFSLNTAAVLTGRSVRTWQRRVEEGLVPRLGGGRALVPWAVVQPTLVLPLAPSDVPALVRADQGDAAAQAQVGALLALAVLQAAPRGQADLADSGTSAGVAAARYFLEQAAQQGEADAMHWLGLLHAGGLCGDDAGEALALMWLARAAAHGHALAREQLAALLPR